MIRAKNGYQSPLSAVARRNAGKWSHNGIQNTWANPTPCTRPRVLERRPVKIGRRAAFDLGSDGGTTCADRFLGDPP